MTLRGFLSLCGVVCLFVAAGCEELETAEMCYESTSGMRNEVRGLLVSGQECANDAECVLFDPSNSCYAACPIAVNSRDLGWFTVAIDEAETTYCAHLGEECWYLEPESCPPMRPTCRMGRCALAPF